eukprot:m.203265 g.203265  ORF g.203265 m.203265 type:complete len:59 (+) comp39620_c2_seq17:632-808(+)
MSFAKSDLRRGKPLADPAAGFSERKGGKRTVTDPTGEEMMQTDAEQTSKLEGEGSRAS